MHVVVWGCPRSGTSITFGAFRFHPDYRYFFEPGDWILDKIIWDYPTALKNPWSHFPTPGLSADLDKVLVYPAKHVWVVRNPHDTVASLRPGMVEQPHPPALPSRWENKPLIDRCAALWRYTNETGLDNLQAKVEVLTVRYEDLITETEATTRRLLDYAGAEWTVEMDHYVAFVTPKPGENEVDFQSRWSRAHTTHIQRTDLTELDRVTIDNIVGDVPSLFGY